MENDLNTLFNNYNFLIRAEKNVKRDPRTNIKAP